MSSCAVHFATGAPAVPSTNRVERCRLDSDPNDTTNKAMHRKQREARVLQHEHPTQSTSDKTSDHRALQRGTHNAAYNILGEVSTALKAFPERAQRVCPFISRSSPP